MSIQHITEPRGITNSSSREYTFCLTGRTLPRRDPCFRFRDTNLMDLPWTLSASFYMIRKRLSLYFTVPFFWFDDVPPLHTNSRLVWNLFALSTEHTIRSFYFPLLEPKNDHSPWLRSNHRVLLIQSFRWWSVKETSSPGSNQIEPHTHVSHSKHLCITFPDKNTERLPRKFNSEFSKAKRNLLIYGVTVTVIPFFYNRSNSKCLSKCHVFVDRNQPLLKKSQKLINGWFWSLISYDP